MKSVRFSQVVAKCGHPETLLLFTEPKKDRTLQAAVKAKRVMTVMQATVGTKTDWGEAGFHPGAHRQYLIFPKSLGAFAGKAVIGIKYDLLSEAEAPRRRPAHSSADKKPARKTPAHAKPHKATKPPAPAETDTEAESESEPVEPPPPKEKPKAEPKPRAEAKPETKKEKDIAEVTRLKREVKRAMQALEKGKQVAAFNLLRKIVED